MSSKEQTLSNDKGSAKPRYKPLVEDLDIVTQQLHPATIIQRAKFAPRSLTPHDVRQLQRTIGNRAVIQLLTQTAKYQPVQKAKNRTGLPDNLKSGIENLSGYVMDDVKVHYNSDKPAQLQAHAYAQGTDIHLGPGQGKYLSHEAWHVAQQKQGRVKPTIQVKGEVNVNDDDHLEQEADVMAAKALQATPTTTGNSLKTVSLTSNTSQQVAQRVVKLHGRYVVPDQHDAFITSVRDFIISHRLNWSPSHAALLTFWLQDRDHTITANTMEALIYNLYYHGDDEATWQNMQRSPITAKDLASGKKRRKRQRMGEILVPSKVQTAKTASGLDRLKDEQLLRLTQRSDEEQEFWKRDESGQLRVLKRRKLTLEDEVRIVAAGDVDDPSYVVWKGGRQLGHRYKGSKSGKNHSKDRTYGSKKLREGYEYKGSGLVDGHSIQAQDDQLILGPMQSEAMHWSTTVKTKSGAVGPTYPDYPYLPTSSSDKRYIEKMPYNFYWENQEQGKHFRQKGIEAPALT
jgi:hypothetical protein